MPIRKTDNIEHISLNKLSEVELVQLLRDGLMAHMLGDDKGFAKFIISGAQACDHA